MYHPVAFFADKHQPKPVCTLNHDFEVISHFLCPLSTVAWLVNSTFDAETKECLPCQTMRLTICQATTFRKKVCLALSLLVPTMLIVALVLHIHLISYDDVNKRTRKISLKDVDYDLLDSRLAQVRVYCNFLEDIHLKDEVVNLSESGLNLTKVIILIRHGDRGSLREVKRFNELTCNKSYLGSPPATDQIESLGEQLEESLITMNLPKQYLTFPTAGQCSKGDLTKFGVHQHIKLGHLLGKLYSAKIGIMAENFHNTIQVFTTPFSRTYQSAISFLHGFASQLTSSVGGSQKWPQFTENVGTFFCGQSTQSKYCHENCPWMSHLYYRMKDFMSADLKHYKTIEEMIELLKRIIAPSHNESATFATVIQVFDGLNAYLCHKEKLPCTDNDCVTISQIRQLLAYIHNLGKQLMDSPEYFQLSWFRIYGLLDQLSSLLNRSEVSDKKKLILFSGHDITIEALAASLGFYDAYIPPYASRLIFEVYDDSNKSQLFRLLYNGKDVTKHLNLCKQDNDNCVSLSATIRLVKSERFQAFFRENFKQITNANNYTEACKSLSGNSFDDQQQQPGGADDSRVF